MKKRILSFLMAGMLLTISPIQGFAQEISTETFENTTATTQEEEKEPESDFVIENGALTGYTGKDTEITIPEGVTSIERDAFNGNTVITKMTFPESLKTIKYEAFNGNTSLKELYFGSELQQISGYAFYKCDAIQKITFTGKTPPTITNKEEFFKNIKNLKRIYVESGCYGRYMAAYGTYMLDSTRIIELVAKDFVIENAVLVNYTGDEETVTVPDNITAIGTGAFKNNTTVKNIILPGGITNIGSYAFSGCSALESVNLPENLITIGEYAFYKCVSFNGDLSIPDSVESIGRRAFYSCAGLTGKLHLSEKMTKIEEGTFQSCNFTGSLSLPEGITSIGNGAFSGNAFSGEAVIPETVKTVENSAFGGCKNLESIVFGKQVESIGNNAFSYCSGIKTWTFQGNTPPNLDCSEVFGSYNNSLNLKTIYIPAGTYKAYYTAYGWSEVRFIEVGSEDLVIDGEILVAYVGNDEKVAVPEGITEISTGAFRNNKTIKKVILPEGVTTIGDNAFSRCSALESVNLPDSLVTIGEKAFYKCEALSGKLKLSGNLTTIGVSAFETCAAFTGGLNIPDSVESVGRRAFYSCAGLTGKLHLSEKMTKIEKEAFQSCNFTGSLSLPEGITSIGNGAFSGNAFSGEVIIPKTVKTVGGSVFSGCKNLESVVFGKEVESIGSFPFRDCTGLKTLTFKGSTPPVIKYLVYFLGSSYGPAHLETIYVPEDALETYKDKWSSYAGGGVTFSSDFMTIKPGNLHTDYTFSHSVKLSWNTSVSERVEGYHIYRNGILAGTVKDTDFSEENLEMGSYLYEVEGYAKDIQTGEETKTAKASLNVTLKVPEVEKIYTEYEGNKLCDEGSTLYASVEDAGNLGTKNGKTAKGRFYLMQDGKKTPLCNAITEKHYKSEDYAVYQMSWDILDVKDGIYTIIFEITDADGETGSATAEVEIDRSVPERISRIVAIGDVNKIVLSWSLAHELDTNYYYIYRKAEEEEQYKRIKKISGREVVSYTDTEATGNVKYNYYITAVNSMGRESEPSDVVSAKPSIDEEKPTVVQMNPENGSAISGTSYISVQAEDNIGVVKTEIQVSEDEGASWEKAGEETFGTGKIALDTSKYKDGKIRIKGLAYDAQGNVSTGLSYTYRVDNTGPEQVKGLSGETTSTTATLRWNDVADKDFSYFRLERKQEDGVFKKVQDIYNTLGVNLTDLTANTIYIYRVVAYDQCGNRGIESEELKIKTAEDKEAPQIVSMNPAANYYKDSIPLKISIKDDTGVDSVRIQVSKTKADWIDAGKISFENKRKKETAEYTLDLTNYDEGSIFVRAVAVDILENEMEKDIPFIEYIVDRTAPSVPRGLEMDVSKGRIELKWEQNKEEDISSYVLYRSIDGENYEKIADDIQYLNYWEANAETGQKFWYQLAAKDKAGNVSERTEAVSAVVPEDEQAPVMESSLIKDRDIIGGDNKTFRILVSDNDKLDTVSVSYTIGESSDKKLLFQEVELNCREKLLEKTLPIAQWTDGEKIIFSVTITDKAGHTTVCSDIECTVDRTAPEIISFKASEQEESILLTWIGKQEKDLKEYQIYRKTIEGKYVFINTVTADDSEEYTYEDHEAKQGETYVYKIKACDNVGNFSEKESENIWRKNKVSIQAVLSCESWMEQSVEYAFRADESKADSGIISYIFDFGDGEQVTSDKPVTKHKYAETGNYKVILTVEDKEGNQSVVEKTVQVEEAKLIGTLKVRVYDSDGDVLSNVPVYFDMDHTMENKKYTDERGCVEFVGVSQKYAVGVYTDGYLPVKKNVLVQAGDKTELKVTLTKQAIVSGNFEINRMTLDEIMAAKIDTANPENQYVSKFTVRMMYQDTPVEMSGYVNDSGQMIRSDNSQKMVVEDTNGRHCARKLECFVPQSSKNSKIIAIIDTPVTASCLKEFFDVRLYIFNQADGEFVLEDNTTTLNIPEGLSIIQGKNTRFDSLKGQGQQEVDWIVRGDQKGSYDLSVDYRGTLMPFTEPVKATFKTSEKIQVYGTENLSVNFEVNKTIRNNVLYFNLSVTNKNPVDVYITSLDIIDNVLKSNQNANTLPEGFPLNTSGSEKGIKILKTSLSDKNNIRYLKPEYELSVLRPGQTFKKYYACYDVINYDGTAFLGWIKSKFEKMDIPVTLSSTEMNFYSKNNAEEKKKSILTEPEKRKLYEFIKDSKNENFYYYMQALADSEDDAKKFGEAVYRTTDCVLNWDMSLITNSDMKDITRQYVVNLLTDESMQSNVVQKVDTKYIKIASAVLSDMQSVASDSSTTDVEELSSFISNTSTINTLAEAIKGGGEKGLKEKLLTLAGSTAATEAVANVIHTYCNDNNHFLAQAFQASVTENCGACKKIIGQVSNGITAWNNSAEFINQMVTISANQEESLNCIDKLMSSEYINDVVYEELGNIRDQINNGYKSQADKFVSEYARLSLKAQGQTLLNKGLNLIDETFYGGHYATPVYAILKISFNLGDSLFEWSDNVSNLQKLRVAASLTYSLKSRLREEEKDGGDPEEFLSTLKYLIKMRLEGEKAYIESVKDSGKKEQVLKAINKELGTSFSLLDEYYNYIQTQLISYRDTLFGEITDRLDVAAAPDVSIDYTNECTDKEVSQNMEYSFDGVNWTTGTGIKLVLTPGEASRHLWIRQKADSAGLTGNIKKILIPTRPVIDGEVKAEYQNGKITFTGLDDGVYSINGVQKNMTVSSGVGVAEVASFIENVQIQRMATVREFASRTRKVTVVKAEEKPDVQPTTQEKSNTGSSKDESAEEKKQPGRVDKTVDKTVQKSVKLKKAKIISIKKKKNTLTIKWKKDTNSSGYEIWYATKKNFKKGLNKKIINSPKKSSIKLKKIKSKKVYYIKIRSFKRLSNGTVVYSKWSKVRKQK